MNFRDFIRIIEANGFVEVRQAPNPRRYRGTVDGKVLYITGAYHRISDEILPKTFASMIRQSGLPKGTFRKRSEIIRTYETRRCSIHNMRRLELK